MNNTKIKVKFYEEAIYVSLNTTRINKFPDSISLVCALESLGGTNFCNLNRTFVILDKQSNEIDLSKSSLFKFNSESGILIIETKNPFDIGIQNFTLAARLQDYTNKGYFPST